MLTLMLRTHRRLAKAGFGALHASKRTVATMTANEIRHRFIEYFAKHGHTARASANIVPANDSTLLFTNAGMVPFKQQFAAPQTAPHATVTSIQKCVRAGGKHNDLDQVGFTPRHHTFFEMLGNFSFGAYGKQQAILMAWRFVREELALPTDRLRVSVLEGDDEAYSVWRDDVKLDASRIVRLGEDDNFWAMGPEGPCGPSSEIFWDTQNRCLPPDHEDRWLEFWNLVFMQYYRDSSGRLTPLEKPCIDTGMGLERMASVMQGVDNNYDTDEMRQIVASVSGGDKQTGLTHRRIIADHLRSSAFLIAEGVHPGSTGRGYVLRRIIRRAVRAGRQLGIKGPVLAPLYPSLEAAMGAAYPELSARRDAVVAVLRAEEDAFLRTLDKGLALLEHRVFASNKDTKTVCAEDVFTLYDTHGFPADLTQAIARDHGWAVDTDGFEALLQRSRQQNRERSRGELGTSRGNAGTAKATVAGEIAAACAEWRNDASVLNTRFCGYDLDPEARSGSVDSRMVAFKELSTGDGLVVINPSPFYTAGGGQEADSGTISTQDNVFTVKEAVSPASHSISGVLIISKSPRMRELLQKRGTKITATVDMERRRGCAVHHTATHLLHSALRTVVGDGVVQAGSQVRAEALRFDFTARALTSDQLDRVASIVNRAALSAAPVDVSHMTLAQAQAMGALSVRAERQRASNVRVVRIAPESVELCGGTHLRSTRAVFPFQTVSESSVGAGTRRIEAVAGDAAVLWLQQQLAHARAAVDVLAAPGVEALESRARQLDSKARAARDEADRWLAVAATSIEDAATLGTALGDSNRRPVTTCVHILPYVAAEDIACGARLAAERAAHLRSIGPMCAHVVIRGRAVALGVDPNAIPEAHAGKLLRFLLARLPGKGGGQDTLAQGRLDAPVVDSTSVSKALSQGPFPIW